MLKTNNAECFIDDIRIERSQNKMTTGNLYRELVGEVFPMIIFINSKKGKG